MTALRGRQRPDASRTRLGKKVVRMSDERDHRQHPKPKFGEIPVPRWEDHEHTHGPEANEPLPEEAGQKSEYAANKSDDDQDYDDDQVG
jgi:hypothetical protein